MSLLSVFSNLSAFLCDLCVSAVKKILRFRCVGLAQIFSSRPRIFLHGCAVDWITQAALGAMVGELMMGRLLGKRALAWGALFGILPELLDVFVYSLPLVDT